MKTIAILIIVSFSLNLYSQDTFEKGRDYFQNQKYDEAIECFNNLLKEDLNNPQYHLWAGKSYYEKVKTANHFERGIISGKVLSHLQRTVKLDTTNVEARVILANYYLYAPSIGGGSVKKAGQMVDELSVYAPEIAIGLKAKVYQKEGNIDLAIEEYKKYINLNPKSTSVIYELGMLYQGENMFKEAFDSFEKAVRINGHAFESLYQIGRTAVLSGSNLERGMECLTKYIDADPGSPNPSIDAAYWRLGMLYELGNDKDSAREYYEKALEIKPGDKKYIEALEKL